MKNKVKFINFWGGFEPMGDPLFGEIIYKYDLKIVNDVIDSDIIISSVFGNPVYYENKINILHSGENLNRIQYKKNYKFDFSLTMESNSDTNFYLPEYIRRHGFGIYEKIENRNKVTLDDIKDRKFCSFFSSHSSQIRDSFVRTLDKYRKIDKYGKLFNNPVKLTKRNNDKLEILNSYKFNVCFENSSNYNYITEKIIDAYLSNTVPIYWGGTNIYEYFEPSSFINIDIENIDNQINHILDIPEDYIVNMININPIIKKINKEDMFIFLENKFKEYGIL